MTDAILKHLSAAHCSQEAWEIAQAVGETPRAVIKELHALQDAEAVLMKNGFYTLSEAKRKEMC